MGDSPILQPSAGRSTLDVGVSPRVSIVVPTYRRPKFLERAVTSVQRQTVTDWELIIVDDNAPGSDDRHVTQCLAERLMSDARIRYLRHPTNRGGAAARNTGVRDATSSVVAFLDDDDEWDPTKLEQQLGRLANSPENVALVYCRMWVVTEASARPFLWPTSGAQHTVRDLLMRNTIGSTSCIVCRRQALLDIDLFDESLPSHQDLDLYVRLADSYRFVFVDAPLVTIHRHSQPRVSTNFDGALRANTLFFEKHRLRIESDRTVLHARLLQRGKLLLAAEHFGEARKVLMRALRLKPIHHETVARFALTFAFPRALVAPAKRVVRSVSRHRHG